MPVDGHAAEQATSSKGKERGERVGIARARVRSARAWRGVEGGGQAEAHLIIFDVDKLRIAGTSSVVVDLQRRSHNTVRDAFCAHAKRGGGAGSCAGSCAPPVVSIPHPSLKPPRPPPARRCRRAVSVGRAAQHRERAGGCVPGRARRRGESHPFRPDPLPPGVSC